MTQSTQQKLMVVSLFGILAVISGVPSKNEAPEPEQQELASRTTQLGLPTEKEIKKEVDVKFADPLLSQKWGINQTDTRKAWELHKAIGDRRIVVAIIDTGADINHPDLTNNLWVNPGETGIDANGRNKATNGVDDDGNDFIDDVHGWNFVSGNNDLKDNHGHGTHIAGIVGAEGGNNIGISGMAPRVSLMILKYFDPAAPALNNLSNTVRAIQYAVRMNANIINYSGGGLERSTAEFNAIKEAQQKGILFVAAAGNEKSNSDVKGYFPADYDLDNIISVTAIDQKDDVLPSSNYGKTTVDIAAPGLDIISTLPNNRYGHMTGTSQATAYVTGVATLIMAKFKDFQAADVIRHITETGDYEPKLSTKTHFAKRLNTYRALAILDQGISANGTIVRNTAGVDSDRFTSGTLDPSSSLTQFGASLKNFVRTMDKLPLEPL